MIESFIDDHMWLLAVTACVFLLISELSPIVLRFLKIKTLYLIHEIELIDKVVS